MEYLYFQFTPEILVTFKNTQLTSIYWNAKKGHDNNTPEGGFTSASFDSSVEVVHSEFP